MTLGLCVSGADCDVTSLCVLVLIVTLHLCVSGADSDVTSAAQGDVYACAEGRRRDVAASRLAVRHHSGHHSSLTHVVSPTFLPTWPVWLMKQPEIWPPRPRYRAATIAVHCGEGGDTSKRGGTSMGVSDKSGGDMSVGGDKSAGGRVTQEWE